MMSARDEQRRAPDAVMPDAHSLITVYYIFIISSLLEQSEAVALLTARALINTRSEKESS